MTTLARLAADTSVAFSVDRENQQGDQLEASFGYLHRAGILRGGVVTKTAANEVSLAANTLIFSKGVVWDIGNNVVSAGPPEVLLGTNPLALTVAGTPSTSIYIYARLVRTAADPLAPTALDTYLAVLSYSASATPASDEYIPLAVVPLDGSGNVTGSIGDVMAAPAGPKYLHQWPNWGYRQVSVAGTGVYTATDEDLAGGGHEYTGTLTGNRQVEVAAEQGRLLPVLNSTTGAFTLTIRTPGTTGIVLARLSAALLWVTPAGVVVLGTVDLTLAGAAPIGAQYLTLAADSTLTVERVLTPGPSLQGTDAGAGAAYTLDVKGNAGTPEGAVTAAVGTLCRDTTNGEVYVKNSGAGNTGWIKLHRLTGDTDLAVADGGTGASTASAARGNLGVPAATDVLSKVLDDALADGVDIAVGTTTGSKIGTASTQKLGFFGASPVVQPAALADTSGATLAALETEVNSLKALLRSLGFLAP